MKQHIGSEGNSMSLFLPFISAKLYFCYECINRYYIELIKVLPDDSFSVDLFSAKVQIVLSYIKLSGKKGKFLYTTAASIPSDYHDNFKVSILQWDRLRLSSSL